MTYDHVAIAQGATIQGEGASHSCEDITIPVSKGDDNIFLPVINVALELRNTILSHPSPQTGFIVNTIGALAWMPDSVYMFLLGLLGEQSKLDEET